MSRDHSQRPTAITPFKSLTDKALHGIREIYESMPSSHAAVDVLFAVDAAQTEPSEAWIGFFVETVCAQIIWDERPTGILLADDASWVLARFDEAPSVATLAILVRLIEEAQIVPGFFDAEVRRRAALFQQQAAALAKTERKAVPYLRLVA